MIELAVLLALCSLSCQEQILNTLVNLQPLSPPITALTHIHGGNYFSPTIIEIDGRHCFLKNSQSPHYI